MPTTVKVAKDPDDIDTFTWDWSSRLATGETISGKSFTVTGGTVASSSISGATVLASISGGTAGTYIQATCRITTSAGRQLDWTLEIPVAVQ